MLSFEANGIQTRDIFNLTDYNLFLFNRQNDIFSENILLYSEMILFSSETIYSHWRRFLFFWIEFILIEEKFIFSEETVSLLEEHFVFWGEYLTKFPDKYWGKVSPKCQGLGKSLSM